MGLNCEWIDNPKKGRVTESPDEGVCLYSMRLWESIFAPVELELSHLITSKHSGAVLSARGVHTNDWVKRSNN